MKHISKLKLLELVDRCPSSEISLMKVAYWMTMFGGGATNTSADINDISNVNECDKKSPKL
ncbi:MAG: hypothetical protein MJZ20_08005 [Bacteroidaceae bacterium]|nr:hypothetical protein [Bacteroidaceae bacterium]